MHIFLLSQFFLTHLSRCALFLWMKHYQYTFLPSNRRWKQWCRQDLVWRRAHKLHTLAYLYCFMAVLEETLCLSSPHRPLKIRTDGSHSQVCELGSIGIFSIFTVILSKLVCFKKILNTSCHVQHKQMLQICLTVWFLLPVYLSISFSLQCSIFSSLQLYGALQLFPAYQTTKFLLSVTMMKNMSLEWNVCSSPAGHDVVG